MAKENQMKEEKEVIEIVEFDDEALPLVMDLLGNEITEEGNIIDGTLKSPISDEFTDEILNIKNFGGALASSRVYVAKNSASLAEYINRYCKE